jgi:AcrR family transcriptional regulator
VAAHGYAATSVERVIERAGVSRGTFYEHFRNRHECLLAAHQAIYEGLAAVASEVCGDEGRSWEDKVCSVIGLTLEFASHSPDQARLLALDTVAAGAESARRGLEAADLFAGMLRTGREHHPAATNLPEVTERALIGAVASAVNWCLLNEESLERLKPQLVYLVLAPYLGAAAAARQAAKVGAVERSPSAG